MFRLFRFVLSVSAARFVHAIYLIVNFLAASHTSDPLLPVLSRWRRYFPAFLNTSRLSCPYTFASSAHSPNAQPMSSPFHFILFLSHTDSITDGTQRRKHRKQGCREREKRRGGKTTKRKAHSFRERSGCVRALYNTLHEHKQPPLFNM